MFLFDDSTFQLVRFATHQRDLASFGIRDHDIVDTRLPAARLLDRLGNQRFALEGRRDLLHEALHLLLHHGVRLGAVVEVEDHLGDAGSHRAGADHADGPDVVAQLRGVVGRRGLVVRGDRAVLARPVERVLELLKEQSAPVKPATCDAYVIVTEPSAYAQLMPVLSGLRALGLKVLMHAAAQSGAGQQVSLGSMKSQFKKADGSGARFALIFGGDELAAGEVTVKSLRDGAGAQVRQPLATPQDWAASLKA